jgi:exopolysaccharide biosynthesis polyprenyl glycosylphosphotransferase
MAQATVPEDTRAVPALPSQPLRRTRLPTAWPHLALASDCVAVALAVLLVIVSLGGSFWHHAWAIVFGFLVLVLMWLKGSYRSSLDLRILDGVRTVVTAVAVAGAFTLAARVSVADSPSVSQETFRAALLLTSLLIAGRAWQTISQRRALRIEGTGQRTLIVGAGNVGRLVARRLHDHPEIGLRPVGFLDKEPLHGADGPELPVLGASWDLEEVIAGRQIEHVVIAFSTAPDEVLLDLLKRCEKLGVRTSVVPRFFEKSTEHTLVVPLGGLSLVGSRVPNPKSWEFGVKHAFDRVGAAFAIILLGPLFVAVAAGVWISLGRPIMYRAERIGRDGKGFDMLKFRSMLPMSEEERRNLVIDFETGTGGNNGLDRRTPFGAFLRRASLDELPQLFNVLKGDMSLVGPRPERTEYVEEYEQTVPRYIERHRVKSGITGWAQVSGLRGKTSLADRAEWDNYYIENWSFWLDLKIFLLTLVAVLRTGEAD